jgi:butyryl-CoA dehydrogenase
MSNAFLTEKEVLLKNTVRDFADDVLAPRAADYDQSAEFPWDNVRALAEMGLFGLAIDEKYGGAGGNAREQAVVVEELARGCASTSIIYIAHLSLCTQFIHMFGSDAQKSRFIPPLARGEKLGAFALTEPGAGSDAAAIRTSVSKTNGHFVLNGRKTFITNAPQADTFVVMATRDPELRARGIDAFIVDKESDGLTIQPLHGKMGLRASSIAELAFDECPVPEDNLLGKAGEGFRQAMQVLNASRISIAAQCVGIAQAAYEAALSYAPKREAFGQRLADFQGIQWMIADMATSIAAARMLVYEAATLRDKGQPFVTEASMAKLFASRVAVETTDRALQIHGGAGYFAPATIERLYREAKVTEIYEGASEIQKLIIARNVLNLQ